MTPLCPQARRPQSGKAPGECCAGICSRWPLVCQCSPYPCLAVDPTGPEQFAGLCNTPTGRHIFLYHIIVSSGGSMNLDHRTCNEQQAQTVSHSEAAVQAAGQSDTLSSDSACLTLSESLRSSENIMIRGAALSRQSAYRPK